MRVALTGMAGFVGGYVAAELRQRGHEVRGLDNFSKYGPSADSDITEGDACDVPLLRELLRDCGHFIACAAMVGGIEYFHRLPFDLLAENNAITAAACEAAIAVRADGGPLRKVTFLSSSMVYESAQEWPSWEGQERFCPPPLSSYGFSKLATEYYARAAWEQYQLPFTIVRPFNCVGVGEGPKMSHVVPDLIRKILAGQDPLHIYGDGNQVRHYTYGGDLAEGIVTAMEHPDAVNEDFNLSSSEGTTVLELAEMIWRKIRGDDAPFHVICDPPFEHDVQRRVPAVDKAKRVLGFEAVTSLSDMVDEVITAISQEASE